MPLESASFIHDLVVSNPAHTDGLSQADSHMRLIKSTLQNTFPNFTDVALASTQAQIDLATSQAQGISALVLPKGTAALPGAAFLADLGTGIFQPTAGQIGISVSGAQVALVSSTALVTSLGIAAAALASIGAYSGGTGQLVPIGAVLEWYDDILPPEGGYCWANGQIIASANTVCPVLLARWGTRFGGNGTTTMGVPDRRDTAPVGKSTMGGVASRALQTLTNTVLGTLFGEANHHLVAAEIPPVAFSGNTGNESAAHTHITNEPVFSSVQNGGGASAATGTTPTPSGSESAAHSHAFSGNISGGNGVHNNVQPSTTCNYILRLA